MKKQKKNYGRKKPRGALLLQIERMNNCCRIEIGEKTTGGMINIEILKFRIKVTYQSNEIFSSLQQNLYGAGEMMTKSQREKEKNQHETLTSEAVQTI